MENSKVIAATSGIKMKEKIGYALGDTASLFVFGLVGSLLQKYYTDVLFLSTTSITILFIVARIWDAINDPLWGRFIDTRKPTKNGRYRPWMLWLSIPLALSTILMFVKIPGLSVNQYLIYAYVTYILFGMLYTTVNIPYGSLASVITSDETERSTLSIFRSLGSGVGSIPAMVLASLCIVTVSLNGTTTTEFSYNRMIIGVSIIAVLGVLVYFLCYRWTKERIVPPKKVKVKKGDTKKIIASLFKSKSFIALCIASMLLLAEQMFVQTFYLYLFDDYFLKPGLYILVTVCTYLPIAILMFFTNKLIKKFGKKELCAFGMLFSAIANLILFIIKTTNPIVFLVFCFFSGMGSTFFILEIWAMVTDVIDHQEVTTGIKEEATTYSFFTFTRKLGQTVAGILATQALVWISYNGQLAVQSPTTNANMYMWGTLIPAILFFLMFIVLFFIYPLSKSKLAEIQVKKYEIMEKKLSENETVEDTVDDNLENFENSKE